MSSNNPQIRVVVTESEKLIIEAKAKQAGKSVSGYLKDLALNYGEFNQPVSQDDSKVSQLEQQILVMQHQIVDICHKLAKLTNPVANSERETIAVQLLSKKTGLTLKALKKWAGDAYKSPQDMIEVGWHLAQRDKNSKPWYPRFPSGSIWQRVNPLLEPEPEAVSQLANLVKQPQETVCTLTEEEVTLNDDDKLAIVLATPAITQEPRTQYDATDVPHDTPIAVDPLTADTDTKPLTSPCKLSREDLRSLFDLDVDSYSRLAQQAKREAVKLSNGTWWKLSGKGAKAVWTQVNAIATANV